MKPMKLGLLVVAIVLASDCLADKTYATEASDVNRLASSDQMTMSGGLRGVNYCEVWLFKRTPEGGIAGVYFNTSALNDSSDRMISCRGGYVTR